MKIRYFLALALLLLVITPVVAADMYSDMTTYEQTSATEIINESLIDYTDTSKVGTLTKGTSGFAVSANLTGFSVRDVSLFDEIGYFTLEVSGAEGYWSSGELIPAGRHETLYNYNGENKPAVIYISRNTNVFGSIISTKYQFFPQDWDRQGLSGTQSINTPITLVNGRNGPNYDGHASGKTETNLWLCNENGNPLGITAKSGSFNARISHATAITWVNNLRVNTTDGEVPGYTVELIRTVNDISAYSTIEIYRDISLIYGNDGMSDITVWYPQTDINKINVTSPIQTRTYHLNLEIPVDPTDPTDPDETPTLRTGTVRMTDNNGTTITGFEVTAINAYNGKEYTVATQSDIAVMSLPMEQSTRLRNPQTGEYEESPVGYYRFYGQSPGYKMLDENGIKVSVLPEKYTSYELWDIRVTSESGPLTGKHKFRIRSYSDNSILQTGTISAKSATTGQWYNTTVSGGIASLILPYDTSNSQSQYAGNYYFYATSPGYEDNNYGTQIIVMPHTESEIRDIHLIPIGGVPTAGNVTLRILAFSETGPGVVNAQIFIKGAQGAGESVWNTYTASSTGYLAVSVPGNSTYDIVASGAGFYDSARRVEVLTNDPPLIEIKLYLSGAPTVEPTTQPTGWPTTQPTTQPTGGIPDEDDDSEGFLMQAVRGIGLAFGVGFSTAKLIFGMLLALSIGYATAKQLRGGAAEFGLGLLGGTLLGVLIGLLPVWIIVVLLLVVGLYIGNRYVGGGNNG